MLLVVVMQANSSGRSITSFHGGLSPRQSAADGEPSRMQTAWERAPSAVARLLCQIHPEAFVSAPPNMPCARRAYALVSGLRFPPAVCPRPASGSCCMAMGQTNGRSNHGKPGDNDKESDTAQSNRVINLGARQDSAGEQRGNETLTRRRQTSGGGRQGSGSEARSRRQGSIKSSGVTRGGAGGGTETQSRRQTPRGSDPKPKLKGQEPSGSLYSMAIQHERRRNYDAARRMFELLMNSYDSSSGLGEAPDGRVFLAWGKMEAKLNNHWAMRKAFAKGLKLIPDNIHIPHTWAIEELRVGNVDVARKLFRYALERDPTDGLVYQSFALLEQQEGNIDTARALLEEGTRKDPTNVFLWSACGVFESRQGRLEEAASMFQQASLLGPRHCQTWQAYGVLLEKLGRVDEAAEKFERALEIDACSVPTLQAYGLMRARRREYDKARKLFERGVSLDATHAPIFHAWARMEEEAGNYDKARELFNSGAAAAPNSVALLRPSAVH